MIARLSVHHLLSCVYNRPSAGARIAAAPTVARTEVACDTQNHSLTQSPSVNLDTPFRGAS